MSITDDQADPETAKNAAGALANGGFVVLAESRYDDAEGNLTIAAQFVTPDVVGRLSDLSHGVVRLCLPDERCSELGLDTLVQSEHDWQPTASIAHRGAAGRGASSEDRARTIQAAIDPARGSSDFISGGYVFPLRARPGGVLRRAGRTEAAVDLARLAGCIPAAAMSLVMNDDGSVARGPELAAYAEQHGMTFVSVADVIAARRLSERLVERFTSARLPTRHGEFTAVGFREKASGNHHIALVKGVVAGADEVLVRVHAECLVGDVFGTTACSCGRDVARSLDRIEREGCGVLLYLVGSERERRFSGREGGRHDSGPSLMDEYGIGAQILAELGLGRIRILTDHPRPITGLDGFGLEIVGHVPIGSADAGDGKQQ